MPKIIGFKKSFLPSPFGVKALGTCMAISFTTFTNCESVVTHFVFVVISTINS